jgi:hypothetical protein
LLSFLLLVSFSAPVPNILEEKPIIQGEPTKSQAKQEGEKKSKKTAVKHTAKIPLE